ncbi:Aste57867_4063 [Aphanomyces stellatus]|uniref:Aste57867_4063 protein n=1 Tax=Aphanomyces stellatus TaxID=120398 RepID=A0A485KEU2_9STRA|nr:hypothetical protein As57867_004052 [Aphanomyces stellatus]VFT81197.1 Aste57867_4063 [Aphanomyces stellatus]
MEREKLRSRSKSKQAPAAALPAAVTALQERIFETSNPQSAGTSIFINDKTRASSHDSNRTSPPGVVHELERIHIPNPVVRPPSPPTASSEAFERKQRGSIDGATPPKSKMSVWSRIRSIDVKREVAENIVVHVLSPTAAGDKDDVLDISVQLRDTTWRIQRSMTDYLAVHAKVTDSVGMLHVPVASDRASLEVALQSAVRLLDPWGIDAFVHFFDNRFGFLAMMLQAKLLFERVESLEGVTESTKLSLKACQETVGKQQVLLNTLQNAAAASTGTAAASTSSPAVPAALSLFPPPKDDANAFLFHHQPHAPSASVWENSASGMYSASRYHPQTAKCTWVPSNDLPCAADLRLNRVLSLLCPTSEAVAHRLAVFDFVSALVKKTLHGTNGNNSAAQVFKVCASASHLFLPDTSLKMSIFFPSADPQWFMKVNEALCVAASAAPSSSDDAALHVAHVELVNVASPRLHCNVGKVVVDISANAFHEIRGAYFLEAMDKLIGKAHLFKRSVLLVHGWLVYESGASTDTKHGEILRDYTVAVMMLYVFNLYHASLHQPLQAIARFFGLFAAFPWDGFCVSIEGPRDLLCLPNPPLPPSQGKLLLEDEMLEMHRTRRFDDTPEPTPPTPPSMHDAILQFNIKHINIMDPIDPSKNLGEGVTAKQAASFRNALDQGATKLHAVMMALKKEMTSTISTSLGSTSSVSLLESSFRSISLRFQCGWRPDNAVFDQPECTLADDLLQSLSSLDLPKNLQRDAAATVDALTVCSESLRHDVLVCDFLLHARVTAPAVYSLATEILTERGPLPIGEIGKCLQDMTSCATLSAVLKEHFGGLKKFLEQYPSVFLISTDHPFNPKVYLHRMLSESSAAQVLDGTMLDASSSARKKKTKTTRRKKAPDGENRSSSLAALPSQELKRSPTCAPPPGFAAPATSQQRSLSFESSLKLSAATFVPADQRKSVGFT